MTVEEITAELEKRRTQLKARKGKSGWAENVRDIEARIVELEAELAAAGEG